MMVIYFCYKRNFYALLLLSENRFITIPIKEKDVLCRRPVFSYRFIDLFQLHALLFVSIPSNKPIFLVNIHSFDFIFRLLVCFICLIMTAHVWRMFFPAWRNIIKRIKKKPETFCRQNKLENVTNKSSFNFTLSCYNNNVDKNIFSKIVRER